MSKENDQNNDTGLTKRFREYEGELHIHVHNRETPESSEHEIDLTDLLKLLWERRARILQIAGMVVLLGFFIALFSPVEYQATAKLMSEAQSNQSGLSGLVQQYGSILGVGGGNSQRFNQGSIPPDVYPEVLRSVPFQVELMHVPVRFAKRDTTVTLDTYFNEIHSPSILDYVRSYTIGLVYKFTIGLPNTLSNLFGDSTTQESPKSGAFEGFDRDSIYVPTSAEKTVIGQLNQRLNINQDPQTGVVTVQVTMPDPRAAAEVEQEAIGLLQKHLRDYKTRKASANLEFIRTMVDSAGVRFEEAEAKLAEYLDSNVVVSTARARTRERELQSEYQLAFSVYSSMMQQLEQAKIRVQEDTPVFSVLQPVTQPSGPSSPNRPLIILISLFLGGVAGVSIVLAQYFGRGIMSEIRQDTGETENQIVEHAGD